VHVCRLSADTWKALFKRNHHFAPLLLGIFDNFIMSAKAIREYDSKAILAKYFDKLYRQKDTPSERLIAQLRSLQVTTETDLESACSSAPWINTQVRMHCKKR